MRPIRAESQPLIAPLPVGGLVLERNLALAPMAGLTNLPFRLVAREAGAALVFTETVSARGLVAGGAKSWRLVESSPLEQPLAYQIFGSEPDVMAEAARLLVGRGAQFIDVNLGCPVKKFIRRGAGSALLRDPLRVGRICAAVRREVPNGVLSVKMRLGWDASSITAPEVARIAEAEGVDLVSVHGRTRAQLYRGRADRARIRDVVEAVRVPVFANGDVTAPEEALSMLVETGAAGVMIGRGAMSNPWIFSQIAELAEGRPVPRPSPDERASLVERHVRMLVGYFDDPRSAVHMLKKYLCAYSSGLPGASAFRNRITRQEDLDRVIADGTRFFREAA